MKFGLFIGRFQPFHKGHKSIIDKIIADGYTPVILIGSVQEFRTFKNPFTYIEREQMLRSVYGDSILITPLCDQPDNKTWKEQIALIANTLKGDSVLYVHNKQSEKGKYGLPSSTFISDTLQDILPTKDISTYLHFDIDATTIRKDISSNLHCIPEQVVNYLAHDKFIKDEFWQILH